MKCRHCEEELTLQMVDLGSAPPSNAFRNTPDGTEKYYPLRVLVCQKCWLVQTNLDSFELNYDQLFTADYAYYSSTSASFVEHARRYVNHMIERFGFDDDSLAVEVGSNDGYLLQHAPGRKYGVEPTATGNKAKDKGIQVIPQFFTEKLAKALAEDDKADWMICNNVLAHVSNINDFVRGFTALLKDDGVATFEFPWLLKLIQGNQFDTCYHEHYSYLSLTAVKQIFKGNGLHIFDVECIDVHGGSLRVYAQKENGGRREVSHFVRMLLDKEEIDGMKTAAFYSEFQKSAERVKNNLLVFLLQAKQLGRTVVAFGAAAKGNTLLNFAGIHSDLISHIFDDTPSKQGKYLPGSRIQVLKTEAIKELRPDYIIFLAWNWRQEIADKLQYTREWGCKFVVAIPKMEIF